MRLFCHSYGRRQTISSFFTFGQRVGGSHPIQKGFIRFFGIICQKMGVLYKITGSFFTIFRQKEGGSGPSKKNPYQKKLRWSKKGERRGLSFFTKSKKETVFFMPPLTRLVGFDIF